MAVDLHGSQFRKGGSTPYLSHLMMVAALVLEHGGDEEEAVAALLHDAAEDQGGAETLAAIDRRFGHRVAEIVRGCSDTLERPKPSWRRRKSAFLERLPAASPSVALVVLADKSHNAGSLVADLESDGPRVWRRFRADPEQIVGYYAAIVDVLGRREELRDHPLLRRLRASLEALRGHVQLSGSRVRN